VFAGKDIVDKAVPFPFPDAYLSGLPPADSISFPIDSFGGVIRPEISLYYVSAGVDPRLRQRLVSAMPRSPGMTIVDFVIFA
jgi:hypothetical protein